MYMTSFMILEVGFLVTMELPLVYRYAELDCRRIFIRCESSADLLST